MTQRASLLRQLGNPILSRNQRAELGCQIAKQLEDVGDYEGAREALEEFWRGVGEQPQVESLNQSTAAEVLLRVGTLSGWLGNCNQTTDAQEKAKNLISQSIGIFEALEYTNKVLEAQTELAYCYWRQGAFGEARIILQGAFQQLTTETALKAKAVLRSAIVERSAIRYSDALRILTDHAPLFDKIKNRTIKGGYHNELGLVFKNLAASEKREDYLDRAFVEYTAASYHFAQAGHMPYCAIVENNLGFLFFNANRFKEAHEHLAHARRIFATLKDKGTVAQVDDTRARVLLAEGRNEEAERVARAAIALLEKGGRQSLLAEALITHGTALARLSLYDYARQAFFRAMDIAHESGALNDAGTAALSIIEELGEQLATEEIQTIYARADEWLETSQHLATLQRLRHAARRVLEIERKRKEQGETKTESEKTGTLWELMYQYEKKLLRQALQRASGSVTQAARLLGLKHQTLIYMLDNQHRDLLIERTAKARRKRNIVKKK